MKRSEKSKETKEGTKSSKALKLDREELESLDKDVLVEKLISLTDQLSETKEKAERAKRREILTRLQVIQRDQKLSDLKRERRDAFYGNGNTRHQLLDPFYYEAYISMKEKIASRDKTIAEQEEKINTLKCSEDMNLLYKLVKSREEFAKKHKEYEYNISRKLMLNNSLNLANTAICAFRKAKKGGTKEMEEKDAKIADLYKEIYQLRGELAEDAEFEQMDLDEVEDASPEMAQEAVEEEERKPQLDSVQTEANNDVATSEDNNGINVDVSVLHKTTENLVTGMGYSVTDERNVSVDDAGSLKITV